MFKGETGSPLVRPISGQMWLEGVLSWGPGWDSISKATCEVSGLGRVFTDVTRLSTWIAVVTNIDTE